MPVKKDQRVITHATPALVTVRRPKSGFGHLRLACTEETCSKADENCDSTLPVATRTKQTSTGIKTERLCMYHLTSKTEKELLIAEIEAIIFRQRMEEYDFHPNLTTEILPDPTRKVIERNADGTIKWG